MKKSLLLPFLFFCLRGSAQLPFAETLTATDTETATPTFRARVCAGMDHGIAFFQYGTDSMDLYDCASAFHLTTSDTVFITALVSVDCDSLLQYHYYQAFALNDSASAAGLMRSFLGIRCTQIAEEDSTSFSISFIPHPIVGISEIKATRGTVLEIFDILGRKKASISVQSGTCIFAENFVSGLYIYRASFEGKVITGKLVIK